MGNDLKLKEESVLTNVSGHIKVTLMAVLACSLLVFGFLQLLQSPAEAFVTKGTSCSAASCHGAANTGATINVALNGTQGTSITVSPGTTFEIDWMFTNMVYNTTKYDGVNPELAVPTGWTVARGTANSPSLTGWSNTWNLTDGVTTGWNTTYSTATEFPNSPVGYSIDYNGTSWDSGNRNAAFDNGSAGDLDGVVNKMGTDARITVPAGASPGTYTVMVLGIGHDTGDTKAHVEQAITVTVSSGISQTITVGTPAPSSAAYNSQFTVAATASSGLPVSYSSGSTSICTNSGATFTMVSGTGTCIVQYDQAGGSGYAAAPRVTNNTTATKINQTTVTVSAPASAYYGQTGLSATAAGGSGTGAYSYNAGSSTACTVNSSTGGLTITSGTGTCSITATRAADTNYNISAASSPATVTINKATQATVTVSAPASAYYGQTGLSATAAGGSGTGAYSYNAGSSTACTVNSSTGGLTITSGTGTCSITATRAADTNYNISAASSPATVTIGKATPTLSVTNSPVIYDGNPKSALVSGSVPGSASNILTGAAASQTNAGTYVVTADFTPTDITNYSSLTGASAGNFVINPATPTASITNSPVVYNGSVQTATVACLGGGSATLASGGSGTNAGSYPATVNCAASANYAAASGLAAGIFVINPATPTASITNSPVVYNGSVQTATVACLGGGSATLASGGSGTNAGSYPATVNCAASTNYSAASGLAAGSFVINQATPTASITNSPVVYNGSVQTATVACLGGGSATLASGGSGTNAGSYPATVNCAASTNYTAASGLAAGSFVINQAIPTASITNSPVVYNGSVQTAAVACLGGGSATLASGGSGTNAGSYPATVNCAASTNYTAASGLAAGSFIINRATPTLSVTNSPVIYDGTPKSAQVNGSVPGSVSNILTGGAASQTAVGNYTVTANFTPSDSTNYNSLTAASAGNFVISAATQTAAVTNSPVTYTGSAQAAAVTCSGGGAVSNIRYNGSGVTPTNAATYAVVVDCAANGGFSATTNVSAGNFIINRATPTLSVGNSPVTYDGTAKSATVNGSVAGAVSSILTGGAASQTNAGNYAVTANFTPTDTTNYNSLTAASAGSFVINPATPTASITNSPLIYNGSVQTAIVACLGGGTATLASGGSGTNAGSYPATVNCAASTNYAAASGLAAGDFVISKADQTIGTITFDPTTLAVSGTTTASATATSGLSVSFSTTTPAICTVAGSTVTGVSGGECSITASQAGDSNYNAATEVVQPITVSGGGSPTLNVTVNGNGSVNSSPAGISCTSGTCSAEFLSGQSVDLTATTSWNHDFTIWSGACSGSNILCTVVVNGPTDVTATFTPKQLVKVGPDYFASMQDAYNVAVDGAILLGRDGVLNESLLFDRPVNVIFTGGNDASWTVVGNTIVDGTVSLAGAGGGSVTISNLVIQ